MPPSPWMKNRLRKELVRFEKCSEHHGFKIISPNPSKYNDSELQGKIIANLSTWLWIVKFL